MFRKGVVLKKCFDPEIPIDLWNLGLIYDINLKEENNLYDVNIIMSLTTPGCSMGAQMAEDIKNQLAKIKVIKSTKVNVTFDPPWDPKMMTDYARQKLGYNPTPVPKNDQQVNTEWE